MTQWALRSSEPGAWVSPAPARPAIAATTSTGTRAESNGLDLTAGPPMGEAYRLSVRAGLTPG